MLTTRNLKLRQAEVEKNINETYRQIKRQPVGGLGALIQKSNNPPQKIPFVPTIFTPAPMTSSLPYLADWVKTRSNEHILALSAIIAKQKVARTASIYYDAIKTAEYQQKLEDNMIIRNQVEPSARDLMTRFLTGEIQKRKREEFVIETLRRDREDKALNPVIPVTPVAPRPDAIGVGDLGARIPEEPTIEEKQQGFEKLKSPTKQSVLADLGNVAGQLLYQRIYDAIKEYPNSRLASIYSGIRAQMPPTYYKPEEQIRSRHDLVSEIVRAKRSGLFKISLDLPKPKITAPVAVAEGGPDRAVGGGVAGGGAFAGLLREHLE